MKKIISLTSILILFVMIPYLYSMNSEHILEVTYVDGTIVESVGEEKANGAVHFPVYHSGIDIQSAVVVRKNGETSNWSGNGSENIITNCSSSYLKWVLTPSNVLTISEGECLTNIELQGSCFRMMSSPSSESSYTDLFSNIFTQGQNTSADGKSTHIQAGDTNVWIWDDSWESIPNLNNTIPVGSGVLISLFDLQDPNDPNSDKPVMISVSGQENEPPVSVSLTKEWELVGNPFYVPIDIDQVTDKVVYIWDNNENRWRSYSNGLGDILNGIISPYQSFFVDNGINTSTIEFTEDSKTTGGVFYSKNSRSKDHFRLEVRNDDWVNSTWVQFSPNGSNVIHEDDAILLEPFNSEYIILSTQKADGTLVDVGHYLDLETINIPLKFESTKSDEFTFTVTDFETRYKLYLHDSYTDEYIRIYDNMEYSFDYTSLSKIYNPSINKCSTDIKQKVNNEEPRFYITNKIKSDIPTKIKLKQNYPNPFNPTTQISYSVPSSSMVRLTVYDMTGREVSTLVNKVQSNGTYNIEFNATNLPSGVYLYRLQINNTIINKNMTLIK